MVDVTEFALAYKKFMEAILRAAETGGGELTEVGAVVEDFLGVPLAEVDPVVETFPAHQVVDLDVAPGVLLDELDGRLVGVSGPMRHGVDSFLEILQRTQWNFRPGAVSYVRVPTGPDSDRRVVNCGIGLLTFEEGPPGRRPGRSGGPACR